MKYVNYGMFKLHSFKNGYTFGYCYKYYSDGFTRTYQILPSDIDATTTCSGKA